MITPGIIALAEVCDIRSVGMPARKAEYIKSIAEAAASGAINTDELNEMDDADIIKKLSSLRGIGVWTAEMLMIFSLRRSDVLSRDDFGIRKGIQTLYGLEKFEKGFFEECRRRYSPYCSVASIYLWEIAAGK